MTGGTSEAVLLALALVPLAGYLLIVVKKWSPNKHINPDAAPRRGLCARRYAYLVGGAG